MDIADRIGFFLARVLDKARPDWIVPVERKGTAILRALMDRVRPKPVSLDWSRIVSSAVVSNMDRKTLKGQRILVFDELMRHGRRVETAISTLNSKGVREEDIQTAVFAVHEDCRRTLDYYCHSQLDNSAYDSFRLEIVQMLQRTGSLLLDTEHLEVVVRTDCSLADFVRMLTACGEHVAVFRSGSDRLNITLDAPRIFDQEAFDRCLPPGSEKEGAVNKCRIVQTNNPNEYAIIPIFFANTPSVVAPEWRQGIPEFLHPQLKTEKGIFYAVGLLTAIQVLQSVVSVLRGFEGITVECPRYTPKVDSVHESQPGLLNHLHAIYPEVEGNALESYVLETLYAARPRRFSPKVEKAVEIPSAVLDNHARLLGAILVQESDRHLAHRLERRDAAFPLPEGIPNAQVFSLAEAWSGAEKAITSAALDRLIDEAYLVTKVEELKQQGSVKLWGRTFEPDGECATARIRRYMALHKPGKGGRVDV